MTGNHPIVVIGGTRGTGLLIVRRLCADGVAVRVLARDPGRAAQLFDATVEIVGGDITREHTLPAAVDAAAHIIFTAGCRSGHPVGESRIRTTEYQGVLNTLAAARRAGFTGRFMYMTSSGIGERSFWTRALNVYKGNTLVWRERAERAIRESGVLYTVIRTGMLNNQAGGVRAIELTQRPLPLSPRYRIARADVAEAFCAALWHPRASCATFEVVWGKGTRRARWPALLDTLVADVPVAPAAVRR